MTNSRARIYLARVLLPFLTFWLCMFPSQSYAFVPAAGSPLGVYLLPSSVNLSTVGAGSAAATVGAIDVFAGLALIGLGASISYGVLDYAFPDDSAGLARLPMTADPAKAVPAPSAAPSAPLSDPTYSITASHAATGCTFTAADGLNACQQMLNCVGAAYSWSPIPQATSYTSQCVYATGAFGSVTGQTIPGTCPAGYSGSPCALVDPRAAAPDKKCDFARSGSALAMISDPDCASSGDAIAELCSTAGGASCSRYGWRPSDGQPRRVIFTPRSDGGTTFTAQQQNVVGGSTVVDSTTIGISPAGVVDSISGGTTTGTIPNTLDPATGIAEPVSGSPVQPVADIQFPSDYARQGEAAQAATQLANSLNTELQKISKPLTDTVPLSDPDIPLAADLPTFGTSFNGLTNWTLSPNAGTCPTPTLDLAFMGLGTHTMDTHCALFEANQGPMQAAAILVWTLLAMFVVLRA